MSNKEKMTIEFVQRGQNIILKVKGEQYSKRVESAKVREQVKAEVAAFNAKYASYQSWKQVKAILTLMGVAGFESSTPTKSKGKKPSKKKETPKKVSITKSAPKHSTITGKQMGQNIILIIDGVKHSKRFGEKEDRTIILGLVKKYNQKNTKTGLAAIQKMMKKEESKGVEKVKKDINKVAKSTETPDSTKKASKDEELAKAKKLLEKDGYTVSKKTAQTSRKPSTRRGEY